MELVKYLPEKRTKDGIRIQMIEHPPVTNIGDIEDVLKVPKHALVKSLLLRVKYKEIFIVAAIPGDKRLAWKKLAQVINERRGNIRLMSPEEITSTSGLVVEGVRPFGYSDQFFVLFDRTILANRTVYCSTGIPVLSMKVGSQDLLRMSGGRIAQIT